MILTQDSSKARQDVGTRLGAMEGDPEKGLRREVPQQSYFSDDESRKAPSHQLKRASLILKNNKRIVGIAVGIGLIILLAAIAGVVVATRKSHSATDSHDEPPSHPNVTNKDIIPHKNTQIAVSQFIGGKADTVRLLVVFQNDAGDLAVFEERQQQTTAYLLATQLAGLPKPAEGSPVRAVSFGEDQTIHVFYLDQDRYIRHVIRAQAITGQASWQLDPDFVKDGARSHFSGYYFATTIFRPIAPSSGANILGLLFWAGDKSNELRIIQTHHPNTGASWSTSRALIPAPKETEGDAHIVASSVELLSLLQPTPDKPPRYMARFIRDYSPQPHPDSISTIDCAFDKVESDLSCGVRSQIWKNGEDRKVMIETPKPLKLAKVDTTLNPTKLLNQSIVAIIDESGEYEELFWEGAHITVRRSFPALRTGEPQRKCKFSQLASTERGMLFFTSCGNIVEFERTCAWWLRPCDDNKSWRFVSTLNLTYPS
ncbi:hypothetical protein QQS21_008646 [Conoideocrella luteorostrata]|uniref:Fucose-specific lectin n=1 Tax=Conoideocrella luteorostrata TaxID=1105319 RepID=A0AAJ0CJB8_9HYPO|nr:hypothetical protein QQS21_008646 [Conoideocrella luteorostrata]